MKFACRIGFHKWGKWSTFWALRQFVFGSGICLRLYRSLRCEHCAKEKNKFMGNRETVSERVGSYPTWD